MISIDGIQGEYTVDLNESVDGNVTLHMDSPYPCMLFHVSDNDAIDARIISSRNLALNVDMPNLKNDGKVIVRNLRREQIVIIIKPNLEAIREKEYVFKLGKYSIEGKSVTFNVISKENGVYEPWSVIYHGEPISYDIKQLKNKITFTIGSILSNEFTSTIVLGQDNSGKEITIRLRHENSDSVEVFETKEAD